MSWISTLLIVSAVANAPTATPETGAARAAGAAPSAVAQSSAEKGPGTTASNTDKQMSVERLPATQESLVPGGQAVFRYGFEPAPDEDPEEWPPGWTRRRGPKFPIYLQMGIEAGSASEGKYALRMQLNGGSAAMFSPPLECRALSDYVFQGAINVSGLRYDRAYFSLSFLDREKRVLEVFRSEGRTTTDGWQKLRIGPCRAPSDQAKHVIVGLHLEPASEHYDIQGTAEFDDLWLEEVPRVAMELNDKLHIFTIGKDVTLRCSRTGAGTRLAKSELKVLDPFGRRLETKFEPINDGTAEDATGPAWRANFSEPGYYRLLVELTYDRNEVQHGDMPIVVVAPDGLPPRGEFGWSMPSGAGKLAPLDLVRLLRTAGVSSVKLPVWVGDDRVQVESLVTLVKDLRSAGIDLIGVLATPPKEVREKLLISRSAPAADVIRTPVAGWLPSLDLLMARLSWQVRAWQLGTDQDASLLTVAELVPQVEALKKHLDTVGDNVTLGLAWPWRVPDPLPTANSGDGQRTIPWQFAVVNDAAIGSARDFSKQLRDAQTVGVPRWVSLEPGKPDSTDLTVRINDLVERMAIAKQLDTPGIYLHEPVRQRGGLFSIYGAPGELLLPWRTTALALSGAKYLGELKLPGKSANRVFLRDGQAILMLSGRQPGYETLYLGEQAQQIDVWGRSIKLPRDGSRQTVQVGPLPVFVVGVDESVTRFRMELALTDPRLPSRFGVRHKTGVKIKNTFGKPLSGFVRVVSPRGWRAYPERIELQLAPGQEGIVPFQWYIPLNGVGGRQPVQFEFDLTADRQYVFTAQDTVAVGLGDLELEVKSAFNSQGELVVQQKIQNQSDMTVALKCHLYIPNQRQHRAQVTINAKGENMHTYTIPAARDLVGQTLWIRAEEMGGSRVLSEQFTVK